MRHCAEFLVNIGKTCPGEGCINNTQRARVIASRVLPRKFNYFTFNYQRRMRFTIITWLAQWSDIIITSEVSCVAWKGGIGLPAIHPNTINHLDKIIIITRRTVFA